MRRPLILVSLAFAALFSAGQDRADAALYWLSSFSSVGRANLDGSQAFGSLPHGWVPALEADGGCGLAVDARHLYWGSTSSGVVGRATIEGTAPNQAFVSGLGAPCGVAATPTHVYWSDFATNMVGRAGLDGNGVVPAFIQGAKDPCGIAVDDAHVYWANQGGNSIGRANLDGSGVDQQFVSGLGSPCGVGVGGGYLFWGDQGLGSVGRAALDGSEVETKIVTSAGEPWDVAVSDSHVFWADRWGTPADPNGGIGRASLDGGEVNHDLVPGLHRPTGVAVDSRLLLPDPSPARPSDYLRFGKLRHYRKTGALRLVLHVPARGEFRVDSPAIGWSVNKGNPPPWVGGTFRWKLKLWPGKDRAGKRIRRRLRRKGRSPIILRMTYQQEGRLPLKAEKRLAFIRRRAPNRR